MLKFSAPQEIACGARHDGRQQHAAVADRHDDRIGRTRHACFFKPDDAIVRHGQTDKQASQSDGNVAGYNAKFDTWSQRRTRPLQPIVDGFAQRTMAPGEALDTVRRRNIAVRAAGEYDAMCADLRMRFEHRKNEQATKTVAHEMHALVGGFAQRGESPRVFPW